MCYSCSSACVLLSHIIPPWLVWRPLVVLLYHGHCHLGRIKSKNLSEPQRKSLTLENDTACKWQVSVPRSERIMGCISEKSHYDLQAKSNDNKTLHKKPIPDSTSNSFIKKNTTMWNEKPRVFRCKRLHWVCHQPVSNFLPYTSQVKREDITCTCLKRAEVYNFKRMKWGL